MEILIDLGELGWTLSKVAPHFRAKAKTGIPIYVMGYANRYHIYSDFAAGFIKIPNKYETYVQSCYRLEKFTDNDLEELKYLCKKHFKCSDPTFSIPAKMFRHCDGHFLLDRDFIKYKSNPLYDSFVDNVIGLDMPFIAVCPRFRFYGEGKYKYITKRNYDLVSWGVLIDLLLTNYQDHKIVAIGHPSTTYKINLNNDRFFSMADMFVSDYSALAVSIFNHSRCSLGTQSGATILGLHCGVPTYQWGHENNRHRVKENVHNVHSGFYDTPNYDVWPELLFGEIIKWIGEI